MKRHQNKNASFLSVVSSIILTTSIVLASQTASANNHNTSNIPLDLSNVGVTKHEIAVMQVLSDICPQMLTDNQRQNFYKVYDVKLQELLPSISDPKAAMRYLSTQEDYLQVLRSIRTWMLGFSKQENKALCEEIAKDR